jgi:putative transposase
MPDHLHLFCAPAGLRFSIERWIAFWKDQLAKQRADTGRFQEGGFHHRLRHDESYTEKWWYVPMNPVRRGLVERPEDWPYQGRVHDIRW